MGISVFFVWQRISTDNAVLAFILFWIQLALNAFWSIIFFGMKSKGGGVLQLFYSGFFQNSAAVLIVSPQIGITDSLTSLFEDQRHIILAEQHSGNEFRMNLEVFKDFILNAWGTRTGRSSYPP
jgi:hypothetical protein